MTSRSGDFSASVPARAAIKTTLRGRAAPERLPASGDALAREGGRDAAGERRAVEVAEGDGERVGRVERETRPDTEACHDGAPDGGLVGAAVADGGELHLRGRVLVDRALGRRHRGEDGAARLAEAQRAL